MQTGGAQCLHLAVALGLAWLFGTEAGEPTSASSRVHAVVVSSSRYWFNYRHANNALAVVRLLRQNGVPDDQITLMLADEFPANPRNKYKNFMYAHGVSAGAAGTLYNETTFVDYRGPDVTIGNFFDVLLGVEDHGDDLQTVSATQERRPGVLRSDAESNVLIYITGHGGDQFFKFQDEDELTSLDIARLFDQLHQRGRYRQLLFLADTCQAFTLADHISAPDVLAIGSSLRDENAYAHHSDRDLGLSVMERYTYGFTEHYYRRGTDNSTLQDILLTPFGWSDDPAKASRDQLGAHVGLKQDTSRRKADQILFSEFFGVRNGRTVMSRTRTHKDRRNTSAQHDNRQLSHLQEQRAVGDDRVSFHWVPVSKDDSVVFMADGTTG